MDQVKPESHDTIAAQLKDLDKTFTAIAEQVAAIRALLSILVDTLRLIGGRLP